MSPPRRDSGPFVLNGLRTANPVRATNSRFARPLPVPFATLFHTAALRRFVARGEISDVVVENPLTGSRLGHKARGIDPHSPDCGATMEIVSLTS